MKRVTTLVVCACAAGLCASSASADLFNWQFPLTQEEEVPMPSDVPGAMGIANVDYDSETNMLSWSVSFAGLSGAPTGAHFHGAADVGMTAGVQVSIGAISGLESPMVGSAPITELQESDLLEGLWYINIHTSLNGPGEIRGQVVPTPGALAFLGVGGLVGLGRPRRAR